jgi:hypothetical protein
MIESKDPETDEKLDIDQLIGESITQLWVKANVNWLHVVFIFLQE